MSIEKSITLIVVAFIATLLAWVIFSREDRSHDRPRIESPRVEHASAGPVERRTGLDELRQRHRGEGRKVDFSRGRGGEWKPEDAPEKGGAGRAKPGPKRPAPEVEKPTEPAVVEVRRGDSFYTIAERELGDGRRYLDIVRANPDVDPRRLKPGQKIVLPGTRRGSARPPAKSDGVASARQYEVRRGDTLSDIAKKFYGSATQWPRLLEANRDRLATPERLRPGMVVVVP